MKPSSALFFLLSTQFISAAPFPSHFSVCWRFRSCRNALAENIPHLHSSAIEKAILGVQEPLGELHAPSQEHTSFEAVDLSAFTDRESLADTTAHHSINHWKKCPQDRLAFPPNDDGRAFSCHEQKTRLSCIHSREEGELLVLGIVMLSIIALIAWEVVGLLDGLWMKFHSTRREQGLIYRENNGSVETLRDDPALIHVLSEEKNGPLKGQHCRLVGEQLSAPSTRDDLSTAALISKCLRGVCE